MTCLKQNVLVFLLFDFVIISLFGSSNAGTYGECSKPNNVLGECMLLRNCKFAMDLKMNPNIPSESRNQQLHKLLCGSFGRELMVCCPHEQNSTPSVPIPRNLTNKSSLPNPPECGVSLTNRIFGGTETRLDEFPWMALIEYKNQRREIRHFCGGALINDRFVLTAAHCVVDGKSSFYVTGVRLGEWDLSTDPDNQDGDKADPYQSVPVDNIFSHPAYRELNNDIALLRLANSATFNDYVKPICLPRDLTQQSNSYVGVSMDIAGWGATELSNTSAKKLKATTMGIDSSRCYRMYLKNGFQIRDNQICALSDASGGDTCKGDSGGPLMSQIKHNNRSFYFLVGVTSFGYDQCGNRQVPSIYTKVSAYMDWIESIVNGN